MSYVAWALLGMAGYSLTTLFVKLATRTGDFGAFAVLAIATTLVAAAALINAILGGAFVGRTLLDFTRPGALWAYAAGLALTLAVGSLFKGLSLGPASVVVPIYGMFILGGAVLGIVVLHEPLTCGVDLAWRSPSRGSILSRGEEKTMSVTTSREGLDPRRRRILFRAWHRGTREMDLLMGRFVDTELKGLPEDELDDLELLMEAPDRDVFSWLTGEIATPGNYDTPVFRRLRAFHTHDAPLHS